MSSVINDRVGEVSYTKYGTPAKIIDYISYSKVLIEFQDNYKYRYYTSYKNFKNGSVRNPYDRSVYNIAMFGDGYYDSKHISYDVWNKMIDRCYNSCFKTKRNYPYLNVTVCDEWLNFQNFANWYDEYFYTVDDHIMMVDKDILTHNNNIYSPDKCLIVPQCINEMFVKSNCVRGDMPIGVDYHKRDNKYRARCHNQLLNKSVEIGQYKTKEEAFYAYKEYKEKYIKQVADYYKDKIPQKLYDALYNYEVLITD